MPANSRDTQGLQNKDKASLTPPHRGRAHRQVRQRGSRPGGQEQPGQHNEVSAKAGEGTVPFRRPIVKPQRGSDLVSRQTHLRVPWEVGCFSSNLWALQRELWRRWMPGTPELCNLKRESLCQSCPGCCWSSDLPLCQDRVLPAGQGGCLPGAHKASFSFSLLQRALVSLSGHFES